MVSMIQGGDFDKEGDLIAEALVREIGRASRWSAAVAAWNALVHVRQMQKSLADESKKTGIGGGMTSVGIGGTLQQ